MYAQVTRVYMKQNWASLKNIFIFLENHRMIWLAGALKLI